MDYLLSQLNGISLNDRQRNVATIDDLITAFSNADINSSTTTIEHVQDELNEVLDIKQEILNNINDYKIEVDDEYNFKINNLKKYVDDCIFLPSITGFYFKENEELLIVPGRPARKSKKDKQNPLEARIQVSYVKNGSRTSKTGDLLNYQDKFYVHFSLTDVNGRLTEEVIEGSIKCKGESPTQQYRQRRPDIIRYIPPPLRNQMQSFGNRKKNYLKSELRRIDQLIKKINRIIIN